jgi:hypothetical protein
MWPRARNASPFAILDYHYARAGAPPRSSASLKKPGSPKPQPWRKSPIITKNLARAWKFETHQTHFLATTGKNFFFINTPLHWGVRLRVRFFNRFNGISLPLLSVSDMSRREC